MNSKISILVDYAHEPEGITQLLDTFVKWRNDGQFDYIIHILSCDGVGRDDWKKPIMGKISFERADFTFVTTDNYGSKDKPEEILDLLCAQMPLHNLNNKYFRNVIRFETMKQALNKAKTLNGKVLICSTGVGSEQGLTQPGGTMSWDEREKWLEVWQIQLETDNPTEVA